METDWPNLVGGHPVLDFANTGLVAHDAPHDDVLADIVRFEAWCVHAGVVDRTGHGSVEGADEVLARAATLRDAVLHVASTRADSSAPDAAHLDALADAYRWAIDRATPTFDDGSWGWSWDGHPPPAIALARMAVGAVELFTGTLDRLKACDSCDFVYLDASKNNSRRWCSMEDCGTREKIRRYVEKRAAARER